jgi:hypothetical protein
MTVVTRVPARLWLLAVLALSAHADVVEDMEAVEARLVAL